MKLRCNKATAWQTIQYHQGQLLFPEKELPKHMCICTSTSFLFDTLNDYFSDGPNTSHGGEFRYLLLYREEPLHLGQWNFVNLMKREEGERG